MSSSSYRPQITLETAEERLTSLLLEATEDGAFSDPKVIIRYAGGWVRDKILQKPSHDVDIAISSLSGHEFAMQFAAYLKAHHPDLKTGSITKILANPEKSKHLDTATSKFMSLDLDFVQLRTESYGSGSRTPDVIGVGTLQEDAQRRDCTMNALYYNVHTRSIEDPTQQGLTDLSRGVITTPMAPEKTFLDDPLRVLRCIRFASQFNFTIEENTFSAMKRDDVRSALKDKVVKERVGTEVLKMMKGIEPNKALEALYSRNLYNVVFCDANPADKQAQDLDWRIVQEARACLREYPALSHHLAEYRADGRLWLIMALLPYRFAMRKVPKKVDVEEPYACIIIREHLKLTSAHESLVRAVFPPCAIEVTESSSTLALGKTVRRLKKDWKLALFVAHLDQEDMPTQALISLMDRIAELNLSQAWSFTPFVDGKAIRPLLSKTSAHVKVMKELMELLVEYKIEDPQISESQAMAKLEQYLETRQVGPEGW